MIIMKLANLLEKVINYYYFLFFLGGYGKIYVVYHIKSS